MKLALVLLIAGTTSVSAAPYYVGQNLTQPNHVALGFQDTPVKKTGTTSGQTANIAAFELKGNYNVMEKAGLHAGLPFYMASKKLTGSSRNAMANPSIGMTWADAFESSSKTITWGYALGMDIYAPLSTKNEGNMIAMMNPSTDLYRYVRGATTANPIAGFWMNHEMFSAKLNAGYGFSYLTTKGAAQWALTPKDKGRHTGTVQLAGSWHALPYLNVNAEWNSIVLDKSFRQNGKTWRHAITPSVSGNYEALVASAFATIPLDSNTRDATNVAFGVNAGWAF